jgi:D-glycero-D-manno-heptose 1,7-bisphosphate phosphatase
VINEDYGYVHKIEDFHFREGIFDVCRAAQLARMKIIVVTNQAGIGRGLYTEYDFRSLTTFMINSFLSYSIIITDVYHCPFHPIHGIKKYKRDSYDRKPNPGMLIKAIRDHCLDPATSLMIGDRNSDFIASKNARVSHYIDATVGTWIKDSLQVINNSIRQLDST